MNTFAFYIGLPSGARVQLPWIEGLPLPRWGEAFKYGGEVWHVADTIWDYKESRIGNAVTYTITLGEDTE